MPLYGEAKREYQREWMSVRRADWIASKGGICAECGSTESLEIDHVDPTTKTTSVATLWSRTEAVRLLELKKCQVLCETCHQAKTTRQFSVDSPHGTYGRYKKRCRCDECKAAVAAWWREYRDRCSANWATCQCASFQPQPVRFACGRSDHAPWNGDGRVNGTERCPPLRRDNRERVPKP